MVVEAAPIPPAPTIELSPLRVETAMRDTAGGELRKTTPAQTEFLAQLTTPAIELLWDITGPDNKFPTGKTAVGTNMDPQATDETVQAENKLKAAYEEVLSATASNAPVPEDETSDVIKHTLIFLDDASQRGADQLETGQIRTVQDRAEEALSQISPHVRVTYWTKEGEQYTAHTITYEEHRKRVVDLAKKRAQEQQKDWDKLSDVEIRKLMMVADDGEYNFLITEATAADKPLSETEEPKEKKPMTPEQMEKEAADIAGEAIIELTGQIQGRKSLKDKTPVPVLQRNADGTFTIINREALKHLDPNDAVGRLTMLFVTYHDIPEGVPGAAEARSFLSALMYQELTSPENHLWTRTDLPQNIASRVTKLRMQEYQQEARRLQTGERGHFSELLDNFATRFVNSSGQQGRIDPRFGFRDLTTAYACELYYDQHKQGKLPDIKAIVTQWQTKGWATAEEGTIILGSATNNHAASRLLRDVLHFDLDRLKNPKATSHYASRAIEITNTQRATRKEKPLGGDFQTVLNQVVQDSVDRPERDPRFQRIKFILKMLGLLGLFTCPQIAEMAQTIGLEAPEQPRRK